MFQSFFFYLELYNILEADIQLVDMTWSIGRIPSIMIIKQFSRNKYLI